MALVLEDYKTTMPIQKHDSCTQMLRATTVLYFVTTICLGPASGSEAR